MLFEQAFMSLPEFLTGLPYRSFDYEGTLMSAFAMAVLQELNGRNINNPISCLRSEVNYPAAPGKRADLHLDLQAMNILTPALSQYGIRQHNWLEAKYFKLNVDGQPTIDKVRVILLLLKDIVRLACYPPEPNLAASQCSRYLLHAYQGPPTAHVAERKNAQAGTPGFSRSWVRKIRTAGLQTIDQIHAAEEVGQFDNVIGAGLRGLQFEFTSTTFAYEPGIPTDSVYWCYLTRLEDFKLELNGAWFKRTGATFEESAPGALANTVAAVNQALTE